MAYRRTLLRQFSLANPAYANAIVSFYEVDDDYERTETLATLYTSPAGDEEASNPITLTSEGRTEVPLYFDTPIMGTVDNSAVDDHETGIIFPQAGNFRGEWGTGVFYLSGETFIDGADGNNTGNLYIVAEDHTSDLSSLTTDITAERVVVLFDTAAMTATAVAAAEAAVAAAVEAYFQDQPPVIHPMALTTPDGTVVTGTDLDSFIMDRDFYCTEVFAEVRSPIATTKLTMDINLNGVSMLDAGGLQIDIAGIWSGLAADQPVIVTNTILAGTKVSFDVDSVGVTVGLKVKLHGYWL